MADLVCSCFDEVRIWGEFNLNPVLKRQTPPASAIGADKKTERPRQSEHRSAYLECG
jgi:hypothetical protein